MDPSRNGWGCSVVEQHLLDEEDPGNAACDPRVSDHLAACEACKAFFLALRDVKPLLDEYRTPEPPEALLEQTVLRVTRGLPTPAQAPFPRGGIRLLAAGLWSLPLVILINASMGWALYEAAIRLLPRTIAWYCVGLFAVWASMAVSAGYASLPLLHGLLRKAQASAGAGPNR